MKQEALILAGFCGPLLIFAVMTAVATRCNYRRYRATQGRPPLADMSGLSLLEPRDYPTPPPTWPQAPTITTAAEAEGYALLAEDRADGCQLIGELLLLVAGAMLGVMVPLAVRQIWVLDLTAVPILLAAVSVLIRTRADRTYEPLIDYYRSRAITLDTTPPLDPQLVPAGVVGRVRRWRRSR